MIMDSFKTPMQKTTKRKFLRPWSPAHYRIHVQGLVPEGCAEIFYGMQITSSGNTDLSTVTCLSGRIADQSELMGVLNSLAEMQLSILSVECID